MRSAATLAALITLTSAGVAAAAGPTIKASAKAVAALCNPHKLPCPKKSTVGSGEVVANVTFLGRQSVPFTLYLGKRQHKADIAAVVLTAKGVRPARARHRPALRDLNRGPRDPV